MKERFQMNRIGFVNFWLYDEEYFEFVDGKLLLRGQNASGKSITTQSIIPFILDGDRTPSRLDPFGSSDRRMEYYFLGRVYEILNDSLQTLTDEDLRAMVDAMEKMDEIQDSLEILKRAFDDVKIIRNEYIRYNQYMLAKKAQAYIEIKQRIETEQSRLNMQEQNRIKIEEEQKINTERLFDLEEQKKLKNVEKAGLLDTNLEEIDSKLKKAKEYNEEAAGKVVYWEQKIEGLREMLLLGERQIKNIKSDIEQIEQDIEKEKSELMECQETLQWDQHKEALRIIEKEEDGKSGEIIKSLDLLKKLLTECKSKIQEYEKTSAEYDEAAAELEILQTQKAKELQKFELAEEEVGKSIDKWIEDIYTAKDSCLCWKPDNKLLIKLEERIREYHLLKDAEEVQALLRSDYEQ